LTREGPSLASGGGRIQRRRARPMPAFRRRGAPSGRGLRTRGRARPRPARTFRRRHAGSENWCFWRRAGCWRSTSRPPCFALGRLLGPRGGRHGRLAGRSRLRLQVTAVFLGAGVPRGKTIAPVVADDPGVADLHCYHALHRREDEPAGTGFVVPPARSFHFKAPSSGVGGRLRYEVIGLGPDRPTRCGPGARNAAAGRVSPQTIG